MKVMARDFEDAYGVLPEARGSAPGRVNLLGEHTDYNAGFVLPMPTRQRTVVELSVAPNGLAAFHSRELEDHQDERDGAPRGFARYLHGCLEVVRRAGAVVPPMWIYVHSDVPIGRGLSSSAALEVATLRALRDRLSLELDDLQIAMLAQRAEVEFVGVRCGILDQMASSLGRPGHALFLDTRTLETHHQPLPEGAAVLVMDSGVQRELAATAYNQRRRECEEAARLLGVDALRDVTDPGRVAQLPAPLDRRARHVVTENARVLEAAGGVDARRFGALMSASHRSLRDDYEVSIAELDLLVELLERQRGCYGARLTGAGFGGACVALVASGEVETVGEAAMAGYRAAGHEGRVLGRV